MLKQNRFHPCVGLTSLRFELHTFCTRGTRFTDYYSTFEVLASFLLLKIKKCWPTAPLHRFWQIFADVYAFISVSLLTKSALTVELHQIYLKGSRTKAAWRH